MKNPKKALRKAAEARKKAEDKKAAQSKGGEDSRAIEGYVKERVREHLEKKVLVDQENQEEEWLCESSLLTPKEKARLLKSRKQKWKEKRMSLVPVVMVREEKETLEQCLSRNNWPPDFFSSYYRGEDRPIYRALEMKSRGRSYRDIGEKMAVYAGYRMPTKPKVQEFANRVRAMLDDVGIKLVLANQPKSEVPAIMYLPRLPGNTRHRHPPIALVVSRDALQRGMRRAGLKLPDGWRDFVIEKGKKDDEHKRKIETAAVNAVAQYYLRNGYDTPVSVELENRGWDLECRAGGKGLLRVEVKGTEESDWSRIRVELTPNEIRQADNPSYRKSYRLAIVRNALQDPKCAIYVRNGKGWQRVNILDLDGDDIKAPLKLTMEPSGSVIVRRQD